MKLFKKLVIFILTIESRMILKKYKPFIVAVTGSVGKTSAKDAIYCVLKDQSKFVRKSEKSLNSEIGLPLTVIGVPNAWHSLSGWLGNIRAGLKLITSDHEYPDCLILEIGADHPGDIKKTVKWLHPDIAVITKVSSLPVHVEFFKSPEEVFEEKSSLAEAVKTGGTVVLFADDEKTMSIAERVRSKNPSIISYGLKPQTDVKGLDYKVSYRANEAAEYTQDRRPTGFSFTIECDGEKGGLTVYGVLGEVYQYPLLAAAAVGKARGMKAASIVKELSGFEAPKGRMNIIRGINDSTIIDDSYNSSSDAVVSALQTLKGLESGSGSKIAILGDMLELGKFSSEEHRKIGKLSAGIVSRLITVGQRSRATADAAVGSGFTANSVESFDSAAEAAEHITDLIRSGDVVLVKGSQSIRMERLVKALMKEPERASELLVRQDKEWLEKS
jgi:UDP-N-acetylmuramoyl-tripeptide--D-alanyl-D-alanine ligase